MNWASYFFLTNPHKGKTILRDDNRNIMALHSHWLLRRAVLKVQYIHFSQYWYKLLYNPQYHMPHTAVFIISFSAIVKFNWYIVTGNVARSIGLLTAGFIFNL